VFLICATGRSREQILAALAERLGHDEPTERAIVRRELAAIAALRLDRLLTELAESGERGPDRVSATTHGRKTPE
jgi:2-oxo-4-hydroxy-4-carboxy-5-ureidoimidazoline decarboxylase